MRFVGVPVSCGWCLLLRCELWFLCWCCLLGVAFVLMGFGGLHCLACLCCG